VIGTVTSRGGAYSVWGGYLWLAVVGGLECGARFYKSGWPECTDLFDEVGLGRDSEIVEARSAFCRHAIIGQAEHAIGAFDLLEHNAEVTRKAVTAKLLERGENIDTAEHTSRGRG